MTNDQVIALLCEFFIDEFQEDAIGVGYWLAQGGQDADVVYPAVKALRAALRAQAEMEG